jgi:hypothetical protein
MVESGDESTRIPRWGCVFEVVLSGARGEPGLQFVPNVFRRGLHQPATAARRRILGIELALRRKVQEDRQDALRPAEVWALGEQRVEGLPFFGGQEPLG